MRRTLKLVVAIVFFFLSAEWAIAQNTKIDSLDNLITKSASDTGRINLVIKKIELLSRMNLDSAINLTLSTLEEAQKIGFYKAEVDLRKRLVYNYSYKGKYTAALEQLKTLDKIIKPTRDSTEIAGIYANWGLFYGMQSKYDSSIYYFEKSMRIYEHTGNKKSLRKNYANISIGYQQKSNFPMALFYQQKALKICEENKNEVGQAYTLLNMANTYDNLGDLERSENTYLKTIELAKKHQLINVELYAYSNLATLYSFEEKWQKSFDIAMKAAELGEEMGDQGIQAASLAKASRALVNLGQANKAIELSHKAIAIADSSGQPLNINQANANMGYALLSEKKWKAAIPFYEKAFESVKDADIYTMNMGFLLKELSECYEQTGHYSKALDLYKQYAMVSDSIRSKENIQKATELKMNYDFEKKEESAKASQAAKDEITYTRQVAMIIGLILSFIIILGALYAFNKKKQANALLRQQKKEIESTLIKLRDTQSQLIQSEKMASLGELTAGIAHEIQNPLNFVNNFSEVSNELIDEMNEEIAKGDMEEVKDIANDVKQNLEKISHHGKRAEAIVKGMLQHSRSSSGVKEPTEINALADEYLRLAYHGLRAKNKSFNATIETEFDENIGKINIIPQDIGRVILNLITNAFYAVNDKKLQLPDGQDYEPTVTVSTKKINGNIVLKVKDNGSGIPENILDKIFQPFFTTKPTGQGTGLGLSMSYDIVTKGHGGMMNVESKQGEGTAFTILLPLEFISG